MTTQPVTAPRDVDNFFDGVGETGAPSFKFAGVGSGVIGEIVDQYATVVTEPARKGETPKVKTYSDGSPIPQLNVTLQTSLRNWEKVTKIPTDPDGNELPASEDDGKRRIYVKYDMRRAVGAAVKEAGARSLQNGGTLGVKLDGQRDTGQMNPLPLYVAKYTAPAPSTAVDDWDTPSQATATAAPAASAPVAADDEPPF